MAKHTPGPWIVGERFGMQAPNGEFVGGGLRSIYINDATDSKGRTSVVSGVKDQDARLIAMAPDLLDFIKRLATPEFQDEAPSWFADAIALIAKVEGGDRG